ncbi:hypothetical protein [Flavobacterium sp.]|uniref:hypothetical protein n=1 Tax=Flavobacterium sp. TaxID=239 RepID=UPI002638D300|nr:hypothetical protein [Flavobacterium sp.]
MRKKLYILLSILTNFVLFSQVPYPHAASNAGVMMAERIASFTVDGAGNDRFEITNATNFDGQFVPQLWSYRETDNRFTLGFSANISAATDNGSSPLMIFSTAIPTQLQLNSPTTGTFPWGNPGTSNPIVNRPLFQWINASNKLMTIIANGNLGLGTTTPTALFHTTGSLRFENLANSTNPSFMLGTDSNGNVFEYAVPSGGTGADADWLKPNGTVPYSINDDIYKNGRVGINVQNPLASLHLNGSVRLENLANSTNPSFVLGTDSNGNVFEYNTSAVGSGTDADWLKPDGTVPYSISDDIYKNGKVGINVQNPSANLHLNGSVRFENLTNSTNPVFLLGTDSNGNVFEYNTSSVGSSSDADWLKLDGTIPYSISDNIYNNGKVGIGINNLPSTVGTEDVSDYRLFVKGGLLTEEVRVALTSEWADYVFKKEYHLPTLKEVEKHIAEKGHLKDIPSEKEVKENGIELGEMNKLLLQKIEELTLYVIDLNKKVEEQNKQIEVLSNSKK